MRSKWLRNVILSVAVSALAGCAFTQWTERYYIGDAVRPPVHENRVWTGAVILPFALVGDIITSPVQVILLVIFGDDWLYSKRTRATGSVGKTAALVTDADAKLAMVDRQTQDRLRREVEGRLAAVPEGTSGLLAWGVDKAGQVVEVPLTPEQEALLMARVDPEVADAVLAARAGLCRTPALASK